jgi:superfamily II DNA or RNA helicase
MGDRSTGTCISAARGDPEESLTKSQSDLSESIALAGPSKVATTPHQACYLAHELTRLGTVGELDRLSTTLFDSKVDLNPHQVEAALFAISNPLQKGVILADEVGLGKTIEAGLVLCQKWAERKRRLIVVAPAHIRKQWQTELAEKFNLPSVVMDRKVYNDLRRQGHLNPLAIDQIIVMSYAFAARMKDDLRAMPFDLVVFDEAHKLRNAYQPSRKGGQAIRWAFERRNKLLLTATPLQNSLLELYGLGWVIDDHVFGDRSAFQSRYCNAGGDLEGLRDRLKDFCKRSLRKDCAYVNYTSRLVMRHSFEQSQAEKSLHNDVLDFMSREVSFAFPMQQRQLIEIILFKSLASSPQALAGTLRTMRQRLIDLRDGLKTRDDDSMLDELTEDDDLNLDSLLEQLDDFEDLPEDPASMPPGRLLAAELAEMDSLIARAESIRSDSKSKALLHALDAAFVRLQELGAKRKALIFTESRKTQAFLAAYLEANGYAGKVVTFNGSNTHPSAMQAYDRFMSRHAGSDKVTGSKAIDMRSALIEDFRDRGEILLATEAAAEGVNLQFCSMVVNYDLPWNPQRIEQRIGRCHRYGQQFDVVVVNFLSRDNIADRRLHDLLQQKFSLFEGLFGVSDDALGAMADGIDFEKRVLAILKSCRTDVEIEQAFNKLQVELEEVITARMTKARQQLFDHFDADVHDRLRINQENAQIALDRVGSRFWRLTRWGLADKATFDDSTFSLHLPAAPTDDIQPGRYRLISAVRDDDEFDATEAHLLRLSSPLGQWLLDTAKRAPCPVASVRFDLTSHPRKISMLEPLKGQTGWLRLDKLTLDSDATEEYLLLTAVTDAGENLDQEHGERLLDLAGHITGDAALDANIQTRLAADAAQLVAATTTKASEAGNVRYQQAIRQIDQWADDRIEAADEQVRRARLDVRDASRLAYTATTAAAQLQAQQHVAKMELAQRRAKRDRDDIELEIEAKRAELIRHLRERVNRRQSQQTLFTIRFQIA